MVYIYKLHITRLHITLQHTVLGSNPVVNLLLVLEDTGSFIPPKVTDGMAVGSAIELRRVVIQLVCITMNNAIFSRNISYLIFIVSTIDTNVVVEILTYFIIPSQRQFNTGILYITTVDVRSTCTGSGKDRSLYQPIFGCLYIKICIHTQASIEETGIDTDIILLGSFPFHILVG